MTTLTTLLITKDVDHMGVLSEQEHRTARGEAAETSGETSPVSGLLPAVSTGSLDEIDAAVRYCARRGMTTIKHSAVSPAAVRQLVAVARAALAYVESSDEDRVAEFDALQASLGLEP